MTRENEDPRFGRHAYTAVTRVQASGAQASGTQTSETGGAATGPAVAVLGEKPRVLGLRLGQAGVIAGLLLLLLVPVVGLSRRAVTAVPADRALSAARPEPDLARAPVPGARLSAPLSAVPISELSPSMIVKVEDGPFVTLYLRDGTTRTLSPGELSALPSEVRKPLEYSREN